MPSKYKKTLPSKQAGTRGDTYIHNYEEIAENLRLISTVIKNLVQQNHLLGQQLLSYQTQLRSSELKNNPLIELIQPILESLRIQVSVTAQKLALIATSTLTIQQAAEDNYKIVDDNLNLPTGLESKILKQLESINEQINTIKRDFER